MVGADLCVGPRLDFREIAGAPHTGLPYTDLQTDLDETPRKIVRRVDPKGPFFSRYEMSDRLEALFDLANTLRETLGKPEISF